MQGLQALDQFKNFVSKIGGLGRYEDTYMVHAAEGETVVPMEVLDRNPILKKRLFKTMMDMGIEPGRYIVGNELNSKNPVTGQPEFFLKYLGRRLRKAAADVSGYVAPVVGAMYGPAAGAAAGAALGQYKRENPGDPNQGMQMALRGGIAGVGSNLAGGQNMFTGKGLSGDTFRGPGAIFKQYLQPGKGETPFKDYFMDGDKTNIGNTFRKLTDFGGGGGKLDPTKMTDDEIVDAIRKGKLGKESGGFSLGQILGYGGLATGILGKLIERGQPEDDDTPIAKNRTINDMIFQDGDKSYDYRNYFAKGGVMDLQDGGESKGPGTGTSDSIPAMLSDGEFVMTADAVRGAGGGDRREGAKKMYEAMDQLEARA